MDHSTTEKFYWWEGFVTTLSNIPTNMVTGIYGSGNLQKQQTWEHWNSDCWFTMAKKISEKTVMAVQERLQWSIILLRPIAFKICLLSHRWDIGSFETKMKPEVCITEELQVTGLRFSSALNEEVPHWAPVVLHYPDNSIFHFWWNSNEKKTSFATAAILQF